MDGPQHTLSTLRQLVDDGASGELVAAGDELEVHIHVYRGRIAWATSTARPSTLVSHLLEHCDMDRDALREVVDECRKTRKRFGETLVEWGVARPEQVREALGAQIREAIESLRSATSLRTLFLPRSSTYSEELTFELPEVVPEGSEAEAPPVDAAAPHLLQVGQMVKQSVPEAQWIRIMGPDTTIFASGASQGEQAQRFLSTTSQALRSSGARACTLRCNRGCIVGRAAATTWDAAWVWCGIPAVANLGLTKAVLSGLVNRESLRPPPHLSPEWQAYPQDGALEPFEVLRPAMDKSDELVSALVFGPEQGELAIIHRLGFDPGQLADQVSKLVGPMRSSLATFFPASNPEESWRVPHTSLHLESEYFDHFSTSLTEGHGPYLWLVMQRSASSGFGWALLTTLARQLSEQGSFWQSVSRPSLVEVAANEH
ncbi:MAG: DUF4388 domain-containing protein [Myxococcota bacterium]